jgi:hypothetical protein
MNQAIQLPKVPKLKSGDDAKSAEQLKTLVAEAQNGLRRVVALGIFCFEIKGKLKHGQFQPWLAAHCPEISLRSLKAYMQLTTGVLGKCKISLKALLAKGQSLPISHSGELLLLSESKVPEEMKSMRDKICSMIDGKTQSQLFFEFKQVDEDEDGEALKPKRGRRKGEGGATKEQRAAAALREEEERVTALKLDAIDFAKWCDKNGDDKGVGSFRGSKEWNKLKEAVESLATYMKRADERSQRDGQSKGGQQ